MVLLDGERIKGKDMKPQDIKDYLAASGWTEDRFGHMKKDLRVTNRETNETRLSTHRIKFQKTSLRFERADTLSCGTKEWFKKVGVYLKDVRLDDTGALVIGNYRFKAKL